MTVSGDEHITDILAEAVSGSAAMTRVLPMVYEALRKQADGMLLGNDRRAIDPTSIVHEVYLKLVDQQRATYKSRVHFLAIAAISIRRLLVDRARRERALKRGGGVPETLDCRTLELDAAATAAADPIDVDTALAKLAITEPRAAQLVELRFFGGMKMAEAAEHLEISKATAERDWRYARAWLYRELLS